jgi:hypothetical protein
MDKIYSFDLLHILWTNKMLLLNLSNTLAKLQAYILDV